MTTVRTLLMALACIVPAVGAAGPGTNASPMDALIDSDPTLSVLDEKLQKSLLAARGRVGDRALVRDWQRNWLHSDAVTACADAACLAPLLAARTALLDAAVASPWNGRYQRMNGKKIDRHDASVSLIGQRDGGAVVWGSALRVGINGPLGAVNYGDIDGLAHATGNTLVYQNEACEISFARSKGGLQLTDNFSCGGQNVTFGGHYTVKGR